MKGQINYYMFHQVNHHSNNLTVLSAILHNFPEPGTYIGAVNKQNQFVGTFQLTVDKECPAMQANIDLAIFNAMVGEVSPRRLESYPPSHQFTVNPGGLIRLYVSTGAGGYTVHVNMVIVDPKSVENMKLVFDSRELREGDKFTVNQIRPGKYSLVNLNNKTEGKITVAYPVIGNSPYHPPAAIPIECTAKGFIPDQISIKPGQGQEYLIKTPANIQIDLVKADDGPNAGKPRPPLLWHKPEMPVKKYKK